VAQTGRGKCCRAVGAVSVAHTHEAHKVGGEQVVDEHVRLRGCESSAVLSRKFHTRMAVLRRSESGRVAVDLLHDDFWGLILGR
jgi:hypothetical protein